MTGAVLPGEILDAPRAIRETLEASAEAARSAGEMLRARRTRRVYVIGNGTSFHSCTAGAFLYRRLARAGDPEVVALTSAELRHYEPAITPDDAIVGISASGEFRDVLAVMGRCRGRQLTIGITHLPESSLASQVDHLVVSAGGPSRVPVMTKTFSATLTATYLVLLELLGSDTARDGRARILAAADHAESALEAAVAKVGGLADRLSEYEHIFVYGGGGAHAAAIEAALKLKEMALVHAEGAETWEMASGGATFVGETTCVIALAPNGPAREWTDDVTRHCGSWGAGVIEVSPAPVFAPGLVLPVDPAAGEDLAPLHVVPPVALLAYELAMRRGATPDAPAWSERYRSQGMTHIRGT
jgi:glucosamine--fructose-6-phosphate aminotransferase (isomerizing)